MSLVSAGTSNYFKHMTESEIPFKKHRGNHGNGFQPGKSGNPAGKPRGCLSYVTRQAQTLLDGEAETLTRKCVDLALKGDTVALKLCLDRVLPVRRRNPTPIKLPPIEGLPGVVEALGVLVGAVATGTLDIDAGGALAGLIDAKRKALETIDLEARIAALEAQGGSHGAS
jgi:Family of unknown function (DUF5681)